MGKLKEKLFLWLANKLHDDLVSNGFIQEDDFGDYFDNEMSNNTYITEFDLSDAMERAERNAEYELEEMADNIQDFHDRLEKVEEFLRKRYGYGDTEEKE